MTHRILLLLVILIVALVIMGCGPLDMLFGPFSLPPADPQADEDLIQRGVEVKNAPPASTPVPTVYY